MPPDDSAAAPVAIVGAGAAGLSAAAALTRRGVDPLLFERDERVGGTWARRYERLQLHTARRFSGLAHYPIPRSYPRYVPKDGFAAYLQAYARQFRLDVRLAHAVRRIRRGQRSGWELETDRGTWQAEAVVVATGHYDVPVVPDWDGRAEFAGRLLHSSAYTSGSDFAGRSVLVVGLGNSGAEIAADLAEQGAARVAVSVRTPPPIVPRDLFGVLPVQIAGIAGTPLPSALMDRVGAAVRRFGVGDLRPYGLERAGWGPFTARRPAVIDVGFLRELRRGRVTVRPALAALTRNGAVFADGSQEEFDAVVAATGFTTGLRDLLELPDVVDERGELRFPSGRATPYPGLYFTGFQETIRGHLYEARRESKRLAREIAAYLRRAARPA
ncbi:MAG: NAD(P)/FAD-dependent oxidoreductase [Thermoleophilia bacterium]|nr:NAD(P)/FAD-dependent oxidoreductase [Thermoleophilia bacterium]